MLPILAITALWAAMALLVNPSGNFPLNDDWCYALAVQSLLEEGSLQIVSIVPMSLVAQVLWGTLFCLPFGFSFTALRVSTLVLGLAGLLGMYGLLREMKTSRTIALVGCMAVAVNPIYFELSNTFMTDVPFFAFSVTSLYAFVRAIRRGSSANIAIGTLFACLATLTRQLGLILPLLFGLAYVVKNGLRVRTIAKALLPMVITAVALVSYQEWMRSTDRLPACYGLQGKMAAAFLSYGPVPAVPSTWLA